MSVEFIKIFPSRGGSSSDSMLIHITAPNPHPQYIRKGELDTDFANEVLLGHLDAEQGDPSAHDPNIVMYVSGLLTMAESKTEGTAPLRAVKASEIAVFHNDFLSHIAQIPQNSVLIPHKDTSGKDLYARREHNHDDRYSISGSGEGSGVFEMMELGLMESIPRLLGDSNPEYLYTSGLYSLLEDYGDADLNTYVFVKSLNAWYKKTSNNHNINDWIVSTPAIIPVKYLPVSANAVTEYSLKYIDINECVITNIPLQNNGILQTVICDGDRVYSVRNSYPKFYSGEEDNITDHANKNYLTYLQQTDGVKTSGWYEYSTSANDWLRKNPQPTGGGIPRIYTEDGILDSDSSRLKQTFLSNTGDTYMRFGDYVEGNVVWTNWTTSTYVTSQQLEDAKYEPMPTVTVANQTLCELLPGQVFTWTPHSNNNSTIKINNNTFSTTGLEYAYLEVNVGPSNSDKISLVTENMYTFTMTNEFEASQVNLCMIRNINGNIRLSVIDTYVV